MDLMQFLALLALFAALLPEGVSAQVRPNAVFFELGGYTGLYSLNYERDLTARVSARIGGGRYTMCGWVGNCNGYAGAVGGASVRVLRLPDLSEGGPSDWWVEIGAAIAAGQKGDNEDLQEIRYGPFVTVGALAGLRYWRPEGRWSMGAGLMPLLTSGERAGIPERGLMLDWAGLRIGYRF